MEAVPDHGFELAAGDGMTAVPMLFLTVGLPGAGKTTLAKRVAAERAMVRFTPDEWMAPLFGDGQADGRRDILEGRMIWTGYQILRTGSSVLLDFGCWSADERYAIRVITESAGARFEMGYVALDEPERRARVARRWRDEPETTFAMTDADQDRYLTHWQPPSEAELAYAAVPTPPAGFDSWSHWASTRWPTLPRIDLPA